MKVVLAGETLSGVAIQRLRERIENNEFDSGNGQYEKVQIVEQYVERVRKDIQLAKPMKVVVDCGSGVAGVVAGTRPYASGSEQVFSCGRTPI